MNINPLKETELIFYGGEFYNGNKVKLCEIVKINQYCDIFGSFVVMFGFLLWWKQTFVYGDLYRYDVEKQDWKLVSSPNSPPPRSAHQAVAWKNYLYIFGTNLYRFKFWRFFAFSELYFT